MSAELKDDRITVSDAYEAMFVFLDKYYDLSKDSAIGNLLGAMFRESDGMPRDLALWSDWLEAVSEVISKRGDRA